VSASVAVQFIETARIFVPDSGCTARRFDYETWVLLGAKDADVDTPGHAEKVLFGAQSGSKVDANLGNVGAADDEQEAQKLSYNKVYDQAAQKARANVRKGLSKVFSDSNAWNTHTIHSLQDILVVRLPILEERKERAELFLQCFSSFDDDLCPPVDVMSLPSQSASIQAKRRDVADQGIFGWKETLRCFPLCLPPPPFFSLTNSNTSTTHAQITF